jgi:hypothetical protein
MIGQLAAIQLRTGVAQIGLIAYANEKPDDYWTKLGYDWYAGLELMPPDNASSSRRAFLRKPYESFHMAIPIQPGQQVRPFRTLEVL